MSFALDQLVRRILTAAALPIAASGVIACGNSVSDCHPPVSTFVVTGNFPDGGLPDGGWDVAAACQFCRENGLGACGSFKMENGDTGVHCSAQCVGRRFEGMTLAASPSTLGAYLSEAAWLEAMSVFSFERLEGELRTHHASSSLIERARAAARDEVRHARTVARLARARGGRVRKAARPKFKTRSLTEVLIENAVEGCVRESFGALIGAHQAENAGDLEIREAMRTLAEDEIRHGQLALDVHHELARHLSTGNRERLGRSVSDAIAELTSPGSTPEYAHALGLPDLNDQRRFAKAFSAEVLPALMS